MLTKKHLDRFIQKIPICNRLRTRSGAVEPEVWFRIIHLAQVGHPGAPVAPYREQTVEIALGPNESFENGNIGTLRRRASANQVVSTVPTQWRNSKLPKEFRIPRVVELLRKAIEWQALLKSGECTSQVEIATREGLTRGRVTQIMGMLHLAPEIREQILSIQKVVRRPSVTERVLRPITALTDHRDQLQEFHRLLEHSTNSLKPRPAAGPVANWTSRNIYLCLTNVTVSDPVGGGSNRQRRCLRNRGNAKS